MRWSHVALLGFWFGCQATVGTKTVSDSAKTRIQKTDFSEPLQGDIGFDALVDLNLKEHEALKDEDVRDGDVKNVKVVDFVLTATKPDGADLAFFERIDFYASAPGLPPVLVASQDFFLPGQDEVAMDLYDVDLTEYVMSDSLTITTEVAGQTPDESTTVWIDFTIDVGVTAKGACRNL